MVRNIIEQHFAEGKHYIESYGLSTDSKPSTNIVMGSKFTECDTGKVYLFNEATSSWVEWLSP